MTILLAAAALAAAAPPAGDLPPPPFGVKLEQDPLPPELAQSFAGCTRPIFMPFESAPVRNTTEAAGCRARHRILARVARTEALAGADFFCPVMVTLRRGSPTAEITRLKPSRCDVSGQPIEAALAGALLTVLFDPLDPMIGDSVQFEVELRGARTVEPGRSSGWGTVFQHANRTLTAFSSILSASNRDKPILSPKPGQGGGGMMVGPPPIVTPEERARRAEAVQAYRQAVTASINAAFKADRSLWKQLKKGHFGVTVRILRREDGGPKAVDIFAARGTAEGRADAIRAALLAADLPRDPSAGLLANVPLEMALNF